MRCEIIKGGSEQMLNGAIPAIGQWVHGDDPHRQYGQYLY